MPTDQGICLPYCTGYLSATPIPKIAELPMTKLHRHAVQWSVTSRKAVFYWLALLCFLAGTDLSASNAPKPLGQINPYVRINGEWMSSYELWNYFRPEAAINHAYDLWILRARLGATLTTPYIDGFAQAQYIGLYGLPGDAIAPGGGSLGLGAAYFQTNQSTEASSVFLKQGFLNFKLHAFGVPGVTAKIGRFELIDGLEYSSGAEKFDGLKRRRIAERLLGGFNAIYIGRSFDGVSVVYDQPGLNLTVSGVRPTQGNLTVQGQHQLNDINIVFAALTGKKDAVLPGIEARLFYMNYDDQRDTRVVDNRQADARPFLNQQKLDLHTVGAHWLSLHAVGSGSLDTLLWGAYQFGRWTSQSHRAWAIAAEAGYQWTQLPLKPWLRAVYYRSSGDGDMNDNTHQTYFSAVPSGRLYAKFPFYNLMNIQDAFVEFITFPTAKLQANINVHQLTLSNAGDLLYGGLGAAVRSGAFGYSGNPAGGSSDIGQLVDISLTYTYSRQFTARVYFGHAFGGDAMKSIYPGKSDANNFLVDFNLIF
ncbi:MAG: alginate export family protein [Nitrosomonas sp.]|nr:MAG: alginate export family protein [Nitrosomonas sp.]